MHVSKGGCVGKTCTIAKLNDSSGGKKSKRRSKEERKGMVETFVKRHQASNNGNFPSLHLTHKEVGGSYYTVREIFRELIQENRVLGPPPGEQNMENLDSFLRNHPLGSISFDPNVHGLPPKDNQTLLNEYEIRREKVLNSRRISERNLDNDDIINVKDEEEFKDPRYRDILVKKVEEGLTGVGETINAETSWISGNDVVNTIDLPVTNEIAEEQIQHIESPIESCNKEPINEGLEVEPKASEELKHTELLMEQDLEGRKDEVKKVELLHHLSEDLMVETFPLRPVSSMVDVEKTSEKEILNVDLGLETGKSNDANLEEELAIRLQDENIVLEDKALGTPTGISSQQFLSNNSSSYLQHSTFGVTTANKNKSDIQLNDTTQKQTVEATLKRVNFEPKEAAVSKNSVSQETNPIVSFIKTFIAAFVKFWSE